VVSAEEGMKARLIRIGNSRGLRLPKPLIEEAGLREEVEVQVRKGELVIRSPREVRAGWAEAARRMRERGEDRLLDRPTRTRFDDAEWRWR
jgi:antitoxin MazE